jgi:flavin-dependent dehydrogenase
MAQLGHNVHLVEQAVFPRPRIGESFTPGVMPLLAAARLLTHTEPRSFSRVRSIDVKWEGNWRVREDEREQGLLVDRGLFDQSLLAAAKAVGVHVYQPARIFRRERHGTRWILGVSSRDSTAELEVDFLADAGGRRRSSSLAQKQTGPCTIALHRYWRGAKLPKTPRIEAAQEAWYWGVPLPDGAYNTIIFLDRECWRSTPGFSLSARFEQWLDRSSLMHECMEGQPVGRVCAIDATPYLARDLVTRQSIRVGDSALAIDPLSSSGVQKAVQSALSGAVVANTLLRRPERTELALLFYQAQLGEASERHRDWAIGHYRLASISPETRFWSRRSFSGVATQEAAPPDASDPAFLFGIPVALSCNLKILPTPCLDGDFISVGPALHHPKLTRPVAYLAGIQLAPLLEKLPPGKTPLQIARQWEHKVPLRSGLAIMGWLVNQGILVPAVAQTDLCASGLALAKLQRAQEDTSTVTLDVAKNVSV